MNTNHDALREALMLEMAPHAQHCDAWHYWPGTSVFADAAIRVFQREDLITLQAYREAMAKAHADLRKANSSHEEFERRWYLATDEIAKKDAALKACVEALVDARVRPAHKQDQSKYDAAIQQAQEAMK